MEYSMNVAPHMQLKIPTEADRKRAKWIGVIKSRYLILALLGYLLIASMVFAYLSKTPVFKSNMSLVLPGSGSSSSFQIEEVGAANSQTKSPFSGGGFNPRVNYKEVLGSREVIKQASSAVQMEMSLFGKPKVKLPEQTSIIEVDVFAPNGELAGAKAWALYEAFQDRLDKLRADEALRRDKSISAVLDQYRKRLEQTRTALILFQERSLLVDESQMEKLIATLENVKKEILFAQADIEQKKDYVNQLSFDLGISPSLAGKALKLQTDTQFRGYLRELDVSAQMLSEYRSVWGRNHPKVKASEKRLQSAQKAAFRRSASLLGDVNAEALHGINLESSMDRSRLFSELLDGYALMQGKEARMDELELKRQQLDDRLRIFARESKELERLKREYDLAQAIFTSAAAKLEASKADVFASYPVIQLLASPTEPIQQTSPKPKLAIAGGIVGFIFVTCALLVLRQRKVLLAKILHKEPAY